MQSGSSGVMDAPIVIFVRPQAAGNIGAISRVMANLGLNQLRLVGDHVVYDYREGDPFSHMDWALSKCGKSILEKATWHESLEAALFDVHIAIGTSGRESSFERGYARPIASAQAAFSQIVDRQQNEPSTRWALVIGPENDGLNSAEAALCHQLIRIPTDPENSSMNAAMATGCLLYHWKLMALELKNQSAAPATTHTKINSYTEAGRQELATLEHCERFTDYLMATLSKTQFLKYPDQEAVKARIRRWLHAGPIVLGELLFAFEIDYHLRAWGSGLFESRDFLKLRSQSPTHSSGETSSINTTEATPR